MDAQQPEQYQKPALIPGRNRACAAAARGLAGCQRNPRATCALCQGQPASASRRCPRPPEIVPTRAYSALSRRPHNTWRKSLTHIQGKRASQRHAADSVRLRCDIAHATWRTSARTLKPLSQTSAITALSRRPYSSCYAGNDDVVLDDNNLRTANGPDDEKNR